MSDSESVQQANTAALRFLAHRPRSVAEVRTRLRRQFPPPVVEEVLVGLRERDLVDDSRFAKLWRDSRESFKPRSAAAIRRELIGKGVAVEVAEETVRDLDDYKSAHRAGASLARRMEQADPSIFRHKLWGHLRRRGFSPSVTNQSIAGLWDELHGDSTGP